MLFARLAAVYCLLVAGCSAAERSGSVVYEIKVTLLEIYNESIQDLLSKEVDACPLKFVK